MTHIILSDVLHHDGNCELCDFFKGRTGYRGQRYEVHFINGEGNDILMGWCNESDGDGLVDMVNAHPVWHSPRIVDLKAKK